MTKIVALSILLSICCLNTVCSLNETNPITSTAHGVKKSNFKLRRLGIFELRKIREWLRPYLDELEKREKQEAERQNQLILKANAERNRIYEKHLLVYQGASSVLKDFHTNMFF